ncbi:MAG: delta tubulin [Monoraphidium minutum]|nr:MAG: delta tubulin [Monoraphidium minutum]
MSVVTLQIGQCGNQLGYSLFEALSLDPDAATTFFHERSGGESGSSSGSASGARPGVKPWRARAVLIDMEPKVIDSTVASARAAPSPWSYAGCGSLARHSGSGNNWALGHNTFGAAVRDDALDLVRRELEAADWLEGFLLLQSVAGGTGAGLGTCLAEALADEVGPGPLVNVCVWPYESGEVSVQPYNALLTLSHLAAVSDGLLLLQNEALHAACTKLMGVPRPGFADLNGVAATALASALLPAYPRPAAGAPAGSPPGPGPGARQPAGGRVLGRVPLHPLGDLVAHLTPHPSFRLASVRHVPQLAPGSLDFTTFTWGALLRRLRQMAVTGATATAGRAQGRAAFAHMCAPPAAPAAAAAALPAHRYRNKAAASALLLRGQGAGDVDASELADPRWHAAWRGEPLMVAASATRFGGCQMAATLLAADQACVAPLRRMQERGYRMASSRAFLHQYEAHGLEEGQLLASFAAIEDTLAAYAAL